MTYSRILGSLAPLVLLSIFSSITRVASSNNDTCKNLPGISNGELVLNGREPPFALNERIPYRCDEDFRSDQLNPHFTCILSENVANWTDTEGACKPIIRSCHDPGYIENSDRVGSVFTFPHNVTYTCKEGFRMKGSGTKYCSKTGQWQPPYPPYCEAILCPDLSHPENGKVLLTNKKLNSIATYKCDKAYSLSGSAVRICQTDGSWNGSNPICKEITCPDPGKFPNGRIVGEKDVYTALNIIIFVCADGEHKTSKCMENGDWNIQPPVCSGTESPELSTSTDVPEEKDSEISEQTTSKDVPAAEDNKEVNSCEDPGKIKNGDRTFVGLHINSTMTYSCDEGYQLRGKSTLLCLESGKWDLDKLPICVKPLSVPTIIGIVFGVIIFLCIVTGGYLWYKYREKSIRGYGKKSKALTADATDVEEIAGLERERKQIPVTVL